MARGDPPRWVPASFPFVAAIVSGLWSTDVYVYHREAAYALLASAERSSCLALAQHIHRRMRAAVVVAVLYFILLVFFAAMGASNSSNACGHKTCGADISWSAIVLATAVGWFLTLRAAKRFYEARAASSSAAVMEMPASAKGDVSII